MTTVGGGADPPAARVPAALPTAVGLHGTVGAFTSAQEEWSEYAERLVHYFVANDIEAEEKRRAILLTAVGPGTYRLIKTLASPKKLEEFTFKELVELAATHFNPKPSPIVKRFEFNSRSQKEGESIAVFVAELRKIAEHCDYGPVLSDMLRDRLVCGTNVKSIQRRLLVEPALTFEKALAMALAAEAADKDSKRLTGATDTPYLESVVNKVGHTKPPSDRGTKTTWKRQTSPPATVSECYRCGGKHTAAACHCREFLCHFCKKKGHLAKMCRQKVKSMKEQAKFVTESDTPASGEYSALFQVTSGRNKPYRITIDVNGKPLLMEIDTGASVSVVGEGTFNNIREGKSTVELQKASTQLKTLQREVPRPPELVRLVEYCDSTPLTSSQIRVWTDHDPTLSKVRKWVQEGWPARAQGDPDLKPYCQRRDELSTEGGCLLWGSRVVEEKSTECTSRSTPWNRQDESSGPRLHVVAWDG